MSDNNSIFTSIIDWLASVRLALFVLFALAVAAIGGTVIPQNANPSQYIEGLGPKWYTFLSYLDMFDMYNSWWFRALMGLLVLNLIFCSARRLPKTMKLAEKIKGDRISSGFLEKQPFHETIYLEGPPENHLDRLRTLMKKSFRSPRETEAPAGRLLFAEKGAFSRFGAYLVHLSLLVIVAGALVGGAWGFSAFLNLEEGRTADEVFLQQGRGTIRLPFSIRLNRFVVKFYPNGMPEEYRSEVTVIEDGRELFDYDIRVNHPLTYRGVTFYQSSYDRGRPESVGLKVGRKDSGASYDLTMIPGQPQTLPDGGEEISLLDYTADADGLGPAVRVLIRPEGGEAYTEWALFKRPEQMPYRGDLTVGLTDFKTRFTTGLQVNRDPGVWLIWTGFGLMMIGFGLTFFFSHQKMFLAVVPEEGGTLVRAAGSSHRAAGAFKLKCEDLAERLRDPAGVRD